MQRNPALGGEQIWVGLYTGDAIVSWQIVAIICIQLTAIICIKLTAPDCVALV